MIQNKNKLIEFTDNSEFVLSDTYVPWNDKLIENSGKKLNELVINRNDFIYLPVIDEKQRSEEALFRIEGNKLRSGNIAGFFGLRNNKGQTLNIKIKSRFDQSAEQYFVHHMLEKITGIELIELKSNSDYSSSFGFDFLVHLFPKFLKLALSQGNYRSYKTYSYSNSRLRGRIDLARHLRQNIPFRGDIAYTFREYTSHNDLSNLVREVIEFIKRKFPRFLEKDDTYRKNCQIIYENSQKYEHIGRKRLIELNARPIKNPFYTYYEQLRKLCIKILSYEKLTYSADSYEDMWGVVYDMSWLWEEYLNTLFLSRSTLRNVIHTENRSYNWMVF